MVRNNLRLHHLKEMLINLKRDHVSYLTPKEKLYRWIKNRNLPYKILNADEVMHYKHSNTLFILGSGPSINEITDCQWEIIKKNDTFGFNFWLVHDFIPTFYHVEYSRYSYVQRHFAEIMELKKERYTNTIFFVSMRQKRRGVHPRLTPELLPSNPKIFYFPDPYLINLNEEREFCAEDFKKAKDKIGQRTLQYRGSLSHVLYLSFQMGYKNIVLLGIDLINSQHFYDYYPLMNWTWELPKSPDNVLWQMKPKANKRVGIDKWIYALNEHLLKKYDISLYVGSKNSLLHPRLPLYDFGC